MSFSEKIIEFAQQTVQEEIEAISKLPEFIDSGFAGAVEAIYNSKGRLVITGIGKSAIIGQKIVATLNSTGTQSLFMHAADAIHGDLGMIGENDVVLCISKSGNTPEIKVLLPLLARNKNTLIAMVSDTKSYLAQQADYLIKATVNKEACPNNLAPTSSTTAQLIMGDAIAVSLLRLRDFSCDDFARFHPGGSLGKKVYMRVADLFVNHEAPFVHANTSIKDTIVEITSKRLGATAVVDQENRLLGIITDGDLRRMLQDNESFECLKAFDIMSINPKTIGKKELAVTAFNLMEDNSITQLAVTEDGKYQGMLHLHDILKEGIVG